MSAGVSRLTSTPPTPVTKLKTSYTTDRAKHMLYLLVLSSHAFPGKNNREPLNQRSISANETSHSQASPAHIVLSCHAFTLAAIESVLQVCSCTAFSFLFLQLYSPLFDIFRFLLTFSFYIFCRLLCWTVGLLHV